MTTTQTKVAKASSITLRLLSYFFLRWVSSREANTHWIQFANAWIVCCQALIPVSQAVLVIRRHPSSDTNYFISGFLLPS